MYYEPKSDILVLEKIEAPNVTKSGLHLAQREQTSLFKVLAAGPGRFYRNERHADCRMPMNAKVGDTILVSNVVPLYVGSDTVYLVQDEAVLCIVTPDTKES